MKKSLYLHQHAYPASHLHSALRVSFFIYKKMSKKLYSKTAITYADQLIKLKSRGLIIEDEQKALHLLEVISYYRLSGYWYPFLIDKKNHKFKENSSFEAAFNLYKFDRELRMLVIRELEKIEIAIRAKMIYTLSHNRGSFWYKDTTNFKNVNKHNETLDKIISEYKRSDEDFVKAFKNNYSDELPPSWMIFEISSFGTLSSLYSNFVSGKDKQEIAKFFGLNDTVFSSWIHCIVYIRNVCAHHTRLWNKIMRIQPLVPRKTFNQWLENKTVSNNKTFFTLSMIIYFMNIINPKHTIIERFKELLLKYPNVDTRAMAFPVDWEKEPLWKK